MVLLITGVGTLFYVAVTSVELVVEGTIRGYQAEPKHYIVARASFDESAAKLEIAGADRTLSPYAVGGRRLASLATQPLVVDFLDIVTRGEEGIEFTLEEFSVSEASFIADQTIGELRIGRGRDHDPGHPQQRRQVRHHSFGLGPDLWRRHPHRSRHP